MLMNTTAAMTDMTLDSSRDGVSHLNITHHNISMMDKSRLLDITSEDPSLEESKSEVIEKQNEFEHISETPISKEQ